MFVASDPWGGKGEPDQDAPSVAAQQAGASLFQYANPVDLRITPPTSTAHLAPLERTVEDGRKLAQYRAAITARAIRRCIASVSNP